MAEYEKEQFAMAIDAVYINLIATLKGWNAEIITPGVTWTTTRQGIVQKNGEVYVTVQADSKRKVMRLAKKRQKEVREYFYRKATEGEVSDTQRGRRVSGSRDVPGRRRSGGPFGGVSKQAPNGETSPSV